MNGFREWKNTRGTRSDVFPSSTQQEEKRRKKMKIKIEIKTKGEGKRKESSIFSSIFRVTRDRGDVEISFSSENGQINPQYIYICICREVGGGGFMRLSRRCLYVMTRYVGEKRSSGHKSLYRNFEFSVSMSMIDLSTDRKQTWDRSAGDV